MAAAHLRSPNDLSGDERLNTHKKKDNTDFVVDTNNSRQSDTGEAPLVWPEAEQVRELKTKQPLPQAESAGVTVAPNLTDLVAGKIESPEDAQAIIRGHTLNEVVHRVLIFGLTISTVLILVGLGLDLIRHRDVPTTVPTFGDVFRRTAQLRPSGFLTLGLLVLVATPILRVIGSTLAFLWERDWRYAAITFVVLVVVVLSLVLGQG